MRSWTDQEVFHTALRRVILGLIVFALWVSVSNHRFGVVNQHSGANLAEVLLTIDHENTVKRLGSASSLGCG